MAQSTFSAVRAALAAYLAANVVNPDGTGLRTTANRFLQVAPPMAVVMPVTGTFVSYSQTFDGETNYTLRIIMLVSEADSTAGQDLMDAYVAVSGASSIYAAVQKDPTLSQVVSWAAVTEATAYGPVNWNGVDYLGCHFICSVGT